VLHAKPDGTCLAEFTFALQTDDSDGDFVQGVLRASDRKSRANPAVS
jgi:hypothetical protein